MTGQERSSTSSARRSRRSARRNTRSPTAASRPACSRRRAGICNAGTVILNIDHYTLLKQAVLKVKGVPMLYLPIMYYPTKKEDRATGFLIPDLRLVVAARPLDFTTRSSGRSTAARTRRFTNDWFLEDRPGSAASTATTSAAATDRRRRVPARPARGDYVPTGGTASPTAQTSLRDPRRRQSDPALQPAGARPRELLLEHRRPSQTFNTQHLRRVANQRSFRRQRRRRLGQLLAERHLRSQRVLLQHRRNSVVSGTSPRVSLSRNERPISRLAGLFLASTASVAHILRRRRSERRRRRRPTRV